MYFPLLRGKQYELVALKEFAEANPGNQYLCPIIEPVRVLPDALVRAADVLSSNGFRYCIVLNPEKGDFALETNRFEVGDYLHRFDDIAIKPIPAFIADGKSAAVLEMIEKNGLHEVMVIFEDTFDMDNESDAALCALDAVSYIVCGPVDSRSNKRFLMRTGKNIIRLDDNFVVRKPNTAYRGVEEDPYTEEPFYYKNDHFYGFADYCVLPKAFAEGGTTPTAVAIHMTYQKRDDAIWVRHFVSDEAFDTSNIRDKFGNAANKVVSFYSTVAPTNAAQWLIQNSGRYPGLGVLKKITMKNHMELISNILPTVE